ncbi:MAG: WD40 repeat domain-containing protein, partial [Acidobacteria bacterium]|nr:WD40 repeat domain-containing protein [Acidobacteriota bacterium]
MFRNPLLLQAVLAVCLSSALAAFAEGTRTWEQSRYDEFQKGTTHGVAISSDGFLELAPDFKLIASTPASAVWATAVGIGGELYAATGAPARVYRIPSDGHPTAIFSPQELEVQALVIDKNGVLYAATNPDGKVYRLEPPKQGATAWNSSVFFDPKTKYIWSLALDPGGNLYVATGDHGEIFRVSPNGEHALYFKSDEPHIRVLAFDPEGNLIAGSDGSGLVYRIMPGGQGFVLYGARKREITSLAIDKAGNIYASAAGEKRPANAAPAVTLTVPPPKNTDSTSAQAAPAAAESVTLNNSAAPVPGGSEIFRISPDGSPRLLWSSRDSLVYALAFDSRGRLLAGTGNRGEIFEISGREDYVELMKAEASQVTSFAKAPDGGLYASTSNLGKIFLLNRERNDEGSYESDVFDAQVFSRWGRARVRSRGHVELFARSGNVDNPDRNWSPWKKVDLEKDAEIAAPPARFIQWKAILHPGEPAPRLDSVTLNYLGKNVAPEFDDVTVTSGVRYQPAPRPPNLEPGQRFDPPPSPIHDRDSVGVKWTVGDLNDDQMVYSVYYRGDGEKRWLLLKDGLNERFYSFDASLLPDGGYTIKVVASDSPSHSPGGALESERESDRFEVDTTPPEIQDLKASVEGARIRVRFRAADS